MAMYGHTHVHVIRMVCIYDYAQRCGDTVGVELRYMMEIYYAGQIDYVA